jgi:hypothetical protein
MKRPKRLLSGLLKCAACGAGMSVKGKDPTGRVRIQCSAHAESRTCPDPHTYYLDVVEDLVLDTLRAELKDPRRLVTYVKAYNEARKEYARSAAQRRIGLERRIQELDAELDRMVQFIAKGTGNADRIGRDMTTKEAELKGLREELALEPPPLDLVVLHPVAIARYEQQLGRLREELEEDMATGNTKAAGVMRELIETITVRRNPETGKGVSIEIRGRLRNLLDPAAPKYYSGGAMVEGEELGPNLLWREHAEFRCAWLPRGACGSVTSSGIWLKLRCRGRAPQGPGAKSAPSPASIRPCGPSFRRPCRPSFELFPVVKNCLHRISSRSGRRRCFPAPRSGVSLHRGDRGRMGLLPSGAGYGRRNPR